MQQLHFDTALLEAGWARDVLVTIAAGRFAAIQAEVPLPAGAERIAGVALPGIGNIHSHAFQRAMAGLTERRGPADDSFWTWREVMYCFLAALTPDDMQAIAAWAYLEMLEAGYTAVGEFHYLHNAPDGARYADPAETAGRIVEAAAATGIGLCLLPSFYAHGGCGGAALNAGQIRFLSDLDGFARLMEASRAHVARLPGSTMGMAPHSLRAVDAPELAALVAAQPKGPIHIHAAEQAREVSECLAWSGKRPVQWLLDTMDVGARWCLIHCTQMTLGETVRLAGTGATVGLCPTTEANLGDGIFEATRFVAAGGSFGIGSDSNICPSPFEELRSLETSQRLRDRQRNCLGPEGASTGRVLYETAARSGARALQLETGALKPGARADIVVIDAEHPVLVGRTYDAALDSCIFASGRNTVKDVFAGGSHVVRSGQHVARDRLWPAFSKVMRRLAAI